MTVLLLEPIHPQARELLEAGGETVIEAGAEPPPDAPADAGEVTAVITRGRGRVSRELMDRYPGLKVAARCGVGVDNIDLEAARARSVPVLYAPGSTTAAVAEHTLMLMLALSRRLCGLSGAVSGGRWEARNEYNGADLSGTRLGVVGLGEIGRRVAGLGEAFGMRVGYYNRTAREAAHERLPLEELLQGSDVVTLHLGLSDETRHLIGERELGLMKPTALLINTSRGGVVDQAALTAALEEGHLGGFAADVLEEEPPEPSERLLRNERALVTPHVAALTEETYREMSLRMARNVLAVLDDGEPEPESVYSLRE